MTADDNNETADNTSGEALPSGNPAAADPLTTGQPMLFDLIPVAKPNEQPVARSQKLKKQKVSAAKAAGPTKVDAVEPEVPPDAAGSSGNEKRIVFIDPFEIEPEPFNGRGLAIFDPDRNRDLIDDMRQRGNTVPVRLRPKPDGNGWTCASGSRRVNAARIIAADVAGFKVAAIVDAAMTDAEAYELCLADNHGRNTVTPMQRGREMKWAIANLHNSDRSAYVRARGVHSSVVSRALDLVNLPELILARAEDRETLPTLLAEKLAPRLKDKVERKAILARANALGNDRLSSARLLAYLLTGERSTPPPDHHGITFGSGRDRVRASIAVSHNGSAILKVPPRTTLNDGQRQELADFIKQQVDELILGGGPSGG